MSRAFRAFCAAAASVCTMAAPQAADAQQARLEITVTGDPSTAGGGGPSTVPSSGPALQDAGRADA